VKTDHLHDHLADLEIALAADDHDAALRHARTLRSCLDGLVLQLTKIVFQLPATDAEMSEVLHG
jgi:hypothetical protein